MKLEKVYVLLHLFSHLAFQNMEGSWLDRKAEGWFWYEVREEKDEKKETEDPIIPAVVCPASLTATEEMNLIRKELEERLHRAILEPTEEHVVAYMQIQKHWINQSAKFSHIWIKNLLNYPSLDSRITLPITQYGVQVNKQILREQKEERIRSLVKAYGLFFFYEGNNQISQAFSFIVKEFAKKYEWQVIAISYDGILIPGFENNQSNQGIVECLGIEQFPSLFLVEPKHHLVVPIAFGLSSVDQIEGNIEIQLHSDSGNLP